MPCHVWSGRAARTTRRGNFWIPGERVTVNGETFQHGGMYVAWEAPRGEPRPYPIVLIHGGAVQGTEWFDTPDGRPGWAERLVDHGYAVFVVDRPTQGRSPFHPDVDGAMGPPFSYREAETVFFPAETRAAHTRWPIPADDDEMLDAFVAGYGPLPADIAAWQEADAARLAVLLDRIGPAILFTHSASGSDGWLVADRRPGKVAAIVTVEPMGPPFGKTPGIGELSWGLTAAPLTFDPARRSPEEVRAADPATLRVPALDGLPVAVVIGEVSPQAGYAPQMVEFLRHAGATVDLLDLPAFGVSGNGHGLIYETNSDAALKPVLRWLSNLPGRPHDGGPAPKRTDGGGRMRLPLIPADDIDESRRELYQGFADNVTENFPDITTTRADGALLGPWGVWIQRPAIGTPMLELVKVIRAIPGLTDAAHQVVILTVGAHHNAAYEIYAHTPAARSAGLSEQQISTLLAGGKPSDLAAEEDLAHDVTAALLRGGPLPEPLYRRAAEELGQDALDAIVFTTAQYSFVAVMLNAYDVPAEK